MSSDHYATNRVSADVSSASPEWLKVMDPNILLVFQHMPKAGGTSLKAAMTQVYGRHMVTYHLRLALEALEKYGAGNSQEIRALVSHRGYGYHRLFGSEDLAIDEGFLPGDGIFEGRDVRYITLIRDPVERAQSLYYFVTTFPAHRLYETTREMSPEQFFDFLFENAPLEATNTQSHLLTRPMKLDLDQATEILDKFYLYATVDYSGELLKTLREELNWPESIDNKRRNVSPREGRAEIPGAVIDKIRGLNQADIKLYEHARAGQVQFFDR